MNVTLATWCTIVRIIITPFLVQSIIYSDWQCASILFVCAVFTDFLDGFLARILHQKTVLGACLDPIADKFLIVACYTALWYVQNGSFYLPWWFVFFVFVKEIMQLISAYIIFSSQLFLDVRPTLFGKFAAVMHMVFIGFMIVSQAYSIVWSCEVYEMFLYCVTCCMIVSSVQYGMIGYQLLQRWRAS